MKHSLLGIFVLLFMIGTFSCSSDKSVVEGKIIDKNDKAIVGVKITASQIQPLKGYELFNTLSSSDGSFKLKGLYPSSKYRLNFSTDKWTTKTELTVDSAPKGETAVLPKPIVIENAFSKSGALVSNLITGATRFVVTSEGVVLDTETNLEWVVGPDHGTIYPEAINWVSNCNIAGGGWRMPTRDELKKLFLRGVGIHNLDPSFVTSGTWVWAEPVNSNQAWVIGFSSLTEHSKSRYDQYSGDRVFGVRLHQ